MLAQRDVDRRVPVVDGEIVVGHRTGEDEAFVQQPILGHQRADRRVVARHRVVLADEDEAVVRVDVALVVFGQPDVVLDLLVGRDPSDEQEVDEVVVEDLVERRPVRGPA